MHDIEKKLETNEKLSRWRPWESARRWIWKVLILTTMKVAMKGHINYRPDDQGWNDLDVE